MNLFKRIAKKIARRFRIKGASWKEINWPNRNRKPKTAVDLWEQAFRFKETPANRSGYYRAQKRIKKAKAKT